MAKHPRLVAAIDELHKGNPGPIIAIALRSADDECRCEEPELSGNDLMCGRCLHRNQEQVRKAEALIRQPHVFVPGGMLGLCGRKPGVGNLECLRDEDHPWHITSDQSESIAEEQP